MLILSGCFQQFSEFETIDRDGQWLFESISTAKNHVSPTNLALIVRREYEVFANNELMLKLKNKQLTAIRLPAFLLPFSAQGFGSAPQTSHFSARPRLWHLLRIPHTTSTSTRSCLFIPLFLPFSSEVSSLSFLHLPPASSFLQLWHCFFKAF